MKLFDDANDVELLATTQLTAVESTAMQLMAAPIVVVDDGHGTSSPFPLFPLPPKHTQPNSASRKVLSNDHERYWDVSFARVVSFCLVVVDALLLLTFQNSCTDGRKNRYQALSTKGSRSSWYLHRNLKWIFLLLLVSKEVVVVMGFDVLPEGCGYGGDRLDTNLCRIVDEWVAGYFKTSDSESDTITTAEIAKKDAIETQYGHISEWDVSQVTDMGSLFKNQYHFNADLSKWTTTNTLINMESMFYNAKKFNSDLTLDTSRVTTMRSMFNSANVFNGDLTSFDTSNVLTTERMFSFAFAFNNDLSKFNTAKCTNMGFLFSNAQAFNSDISKFNTAQCTNMRSMFAGAIKFNQNLLSFDTAKVTDMSDLFSGASAFNGDLGNFLTSKVLTMHSMFNDATNFNRPLPFDTSSVTNMEAMFSGASAFNGDISKFNTAQCTNMRFMFAGAIKFNQNLLSFDTAKVTDMSDLFSNAKMFDREVSHFNTSVTNSLAGMFENAVLFNSDVSNWDTSSVVNIQRMFTGAAQFNTDLSKWDTSSITDMYRLFESSGFKRTLCGAQWDKFSGSKLTSTGRYGCCPAGSFMSNPMQDPFSIASSCQQCPAGQFGSAIENDETFCPNCPIGKSNVAGSAICKVCPSGRILTTKIPLLCTVCPAGKLQPASQFDPAIECSVCAAGLYIADDSQNDAEHVSCNYCPKGKEFTTITTACNVCSFSKYQDQDNEPSVSCTKCPANTYITDNEELADAHVNIASCTACAEGKVAKSGDRVCDICSAGKELKGASCSICLSGLFSTIETAYKCVNCPLGYSQPKGGTPYCLPCLPGEYQPDAGKPTCLLCAKNKKSKDTNSTRCY